MACAHTGRLTLVFFFIMTYTNLILIQHTLRCFFVTMYVVTMTPDNCDGRARYVYIAPLITNIINDIDDIYIHCTFVDHDVAIA
jgi:hypothetical protein